MTGSSDLSLLALLLTGGGSALRRQVSAVRSGGGCLEAALTGHLPPALVAEARRTREHAVPNLLERLHERGWRWVASSEPDYPDRLNDTADPPLGLFIKGRLQPKPTVAIVGSRRATPYGLQAARHLADAVARAGGSVVSGMARGIDGAAHEGALEAGGHTAAVWGCGPDRIYPPEHTALAERIGAAGALITEYPPGTPPRRHHFPERNRLVAGLASVVVVVEAAARSGALSTARQALDEGREVMAVPGSIFSEASIGPHGLLREGAVPVTGAEDVLEALGLEASDAPPADQPPLPLDWGEAATVDELAARMETGIDRVQAAVVEMEIQGLIERRPDGSVVRRR